MNEMKYWAFEDRRSQTPGISALEEKLSEWSRGWEKSLAEWKAYAERLRLKREVKDFKNPI